MKRVVVVALLGLSCATSRVPQSLRGYDIVIEGSDELSRELARAMREFGFHVRQQVRGGSRPTAALIHFTFSDPGPDQTAWLNLRLADTRSGAIVGVGAVQLDSSMATARARATAAVQTISAP